MIKKADKKENHHYVHEAYLRAWKADNQLFVFDLVKKESYDPKGRYGAGVKRKFYDFSFDETVISLLNYTFEQRAHQKESDGVYAGLLTFINFMKDHPYEHKTQNLLEDFYGYYENLIGKALQNVFRDELQIISHDPAVSEGLIYLYCLQLMRTPKARRLTSEKLIDLTYSNVVLNEQQKDEYLKMLLLFFSLAMAADMQRKGCVIRLHYARYGEKFVNSDVPVIQLSQDIARIENHRGCIPLSPRLLMEVDNIGIGHKLPLYGEIQNNEVERINLKMISNADRQVFFNSRNHRIKYLKPMLARRP